MGCNAYLDTAFTKKDFGEAHLVIAPFNESCQPHDILHLLQLLRFILALLLLEARESPHEISNQEASRKSGPCHTHCLNHSSTTQLMHDK
jgi:hypothetical protein